MTKRYATYFEMNNVKADLLAWQSTRLILSYPFSN